MFNLAQVLEHLSDEVNALENPVALDRQIVVNDQFPAVLMPFGISAIQNSGYLRWRQAGVVCR